MNRANHYRKNWKPMKPLKLTFALCLLMLAPATGLHAQAFDKGITAINLGIGLGGARYSYISSYNSDYKTSPTIIASIEHGVATVDGIGAIGVGGLFANKSVRYKSTSQSFSTTYEYDRKWSNTVVGLRGTLHLNELLESDQFDVYGGVMLGYNIGSYKDKSTKTYNGVTTDFSDDYHYKLSFVTWSTFIGGRYLFTDHLGAYLEVGYGASYLNLGLTAKF